MPIKPATIINKRYDDRAITTRTIYARNAQGEIIAQRIPRTTPNARQAVKRACVEHARQKLITHRQKGFSLRRFLGLD
jgi:hypothetical protein